MKTIAKCKEQEISKKYVGRNFIPKRVCFRTTDEIANFFEGSIPIEIEKAIQILQAKQSKNLTSAIQEQIQEIGFVSRFRGFNSHSGDMYAYQAANGKWYFSIGRSNIAQAGRGLDIEI